MAFSDPNDTAIRHLVEEVLRRIRDAVAAPAAVPASHPVAAAAPAAVAARPAPPALAGIATTDARVVTLDIVARLPAGTRQLTVPPRAVITPAARDLAHEAGITITLAAATAASASAPRPFVVALAEVDGEGVARATAIVRGVPGAVQIPASGLPDVVQALAGHASRDGARAVLLTSRPAAAVVAACRLAALRAATGRDAAAVAAAVVETEANLLVLNPRDFPGRALERAAVAFATRAGQAIPVALAAAAPGCACKSHAH